MELTKEEFNHLRFIYIKLINQYDECESIYYMKEFKRIVAKGNYKPTSPLTPNGGVLKKRGLFDWITKDRVKFLFKDNKELIKLEDRIGVLENKVSEMLPDLN